MIPTLDTMFVLTSCARFDLLVETMLTLLEHNTAPIARYVVIEDAGDEAPAYETTGWFRHVDRAPMRRSASGRTE